MKRRVNPHPTIIASRWYYGELIIPAGRNCSGIRWNCLTDSGHWLRADTLAGIKSLIREAKGIDPS